MTNDELRTAFEAVISGNGKWPQAIERGPGGTYLLASVAIAWLSWQEARDIVLAKAAYGWISVEDRMPPDDTPVLVYTPSYSESLPFAIDEWRMQREAPVSWSSHTVETGMAWCEHEFDEVTHWRPLTAPAALAAKESGNDA